MNPQKKYDVFISYSRKDSALADKICSAFDQVGITYFIDRSGILSGEQYAGTIISAIENARFIIYLMSENSSESTWKLNDNIPLILKLVDGYNFKNLH